MTVDDEPVDLRNPGLLLVLVRTHWPPLRQLDRTVADRLNDLVADNGVVVNALTALTNLGGTPMLLWLLTVGTAWLLIRRQPLLAAYVVVTALGAFVLNAVVKELVDRLRPAVDVPVAVAPGLVSLWLGATHSGATATPRRRITGAGPG